MLIDRASQTRSQSQTYGSRPLFKLALQMLCKACLAGHVGLKQLLGSCLHPLSHAVPASTLGSMQLPPGSDNFRPCLQPLSPSPPTGLHSTQIARAVLPCVVWVERGDSV